MSHIAELKKYAHTLTDLRNTLELLHWDQETYLPASAHNERAEQIATLTKIIHEYETSSTLQKLLDQAQSEVHQQAEADTIADKALVRVMQRDFDKATKLSNAFVAEFASVTAKALQVWVEAKKQYRFADFAPTLEKIVDLCRQKADYLGYSESPYDALLDLYEEGATTSQVATLFQNLRNELVPLIPMIQAKWHSPLAIHQDIPAHIQEQLAQEALHWIGYDFRSGRQDASAHPFTISLGHSDRRVTNRYQPRDLSFLFSALHEGGHGIYEQGTNPELARTPLDTGVSLGIHESQSRLWENIIGRSKIFWHTHFPRVYEVLSPYIHNLTPESWYAGINHVQPSLIRTEADEVTYCLHIIIRFEIERDLFEKKLEVKDVQEAWNHKYKQYLGVEVPNDSQGVLQDIHWSYGNHGYFPTYAIGTILSAQIWQTYTQNQPDYQHHLNQGDTTMLKDWLTYQIYQHGSIFTPTELIQKVTGNNLDHQPFIAYLKQKYL
jgi:carboxypeptidase Taq